MVRYTVLRENHIQGSPVGDQFVHRAIWWQCLTAEQKLVPPFWFYCCAWFGNHPLESSRALYFFLEKNKKARLLNFDRCILGSQIEMGLVLIPYPRSFFTRIPHPELLSSLSRISFSSGSGRCRNLLDQRPSKALISLVPITCTTYFFRERDIVMSPSLLFSQPITNLVWNRCRFSGNSQTSYSVNVSRIQRCFLGKSLISGIPFQTRRKKPESTLAYLSAAYPAMSG